MVSTRRQVINEQDRYGGYETTSKGRVVTELPELDSGEIFSGFEGTQAQNAGGQSFSYTVVEPARRAKTEPTPIIEPAQKPVTEPKPRVRRSGEDIMPSINRRNAKAEATEVKEDVQKADKLDRAAATTRTKVILAVYLAAVIVLAAIVIVTGVLVAGSSSAVARLEGELALKNETVLQRQHALEMVSDDNNIKGRAADLNMTNVKNATEVETSGGVAVVKYESRTNWFDIFCDWLSGILT